MIFNKYGRLYSSKQIMHSPKGPNWLIEVLNWLPTTLIFWKKVILIGLPLLYIRVMPIGITQA